MALFSYQFRNNLGSIVPSQEVKDLNDQTQDREAEETKETNSTNNSQAEVKQRESFAHFSRRMFGKLNELYLLLTEYAWRILRLHLYKLIILILGIFCFSKVNLMNLVLFCSVLLSLMLDKTGNNEKRIKTLFSGFVQIWIIICVIATMIFQLKFIESPFIFNCNGTFYNQSTVDPFLLENHDSFEYIGIEKTPLILENLKVHKISYSTRILYEFNYLEHRSIIHGYFFKYQWIRGPDCHLGQNLIHYGTLFEEIRSFDLKTINFKKSIGRLLLI